jgi:hypothetical protein
MKTRRARTVWLCSVALLSAACASGEEAETGKEMSAANGDDDGKGDGDGDGDDTPTQGDADDSSTPGDGDSTPVSGDGDGHGDQSGLAKVADCSGDAPAELDDLVTGFEDGTVGVNPVEGRGGGFYIFNDQDNDATAQPFAVDAIDRCEDGSSLYSFCTKGSGFKLWGAGFGTDLGVVDPDTMKKSAVDLSAYRGISFWIAGNPGSKAPTVKVMLPDVNTAAEGGHCTNEGTEPTDKCDPFVKNIPVPAKWTHVEVPFDDLRQGGWGKKVPAFAKDGVFGIQLQFAAGVAFDVCFDQLVLLR